jgi:hypothetical protein
MILSNFSMCFIVYMPLQPTQKNGTLKPLIRSTLCNILYCVERKLCIHGWTCRDEFFYRTWESRTG